MSRATRRSRLGSMRAQRRQAEKSVARILELSEQGFSPSTIASSVGVSEQHVDRIRFLLGKADHGPEASGETIAAQGGGG